MVKMAATGTEAEGRAAERALALSYAPTITRPALEALFALDATLGRIVRAAREPIIAQMRLTWWHDALAALDERPAPAEPLLRTLAAEVLPRGVPGERLAGLIDGWEAVLDDPLDAAALATVAERRGAGLFQAAAIVLGAPDLPVDDAGAGWALADVAVNLSLKAVAEQACMLAAPRLDAALSLAWPRVARALGALALLARADCRGTRPGAPARVGRLLVHRVTGR